MAKMTVRSMVMIETVVDADNADDAGDYAGRAIAVILRKAGVDFDFCDDYRVFDENGNDVVDTTF
jgi:hypothetical protein